MIIRSLCRASRAKDIVPRSRTTILPTWQTYRQFRTSLRAELQVAEMDHETLASIRINQERLMSDIHSTSEWGPGERWGEGSSEVGMRRLSLTDSDRQARDWFASTTQSLGCKVHTDKMGNQFAIRPGLNNDAPPTYAGSHLDTQPSGGRYDGILGVVAGVELLRTLNDNWIETSYPVGVVNWTNEEGARFPKSMVSSGVWAGHVDLETAHNLKSVIPQGDEATMKSELERIGYLGDVEANYKASPMAAHFELHIEQGPILEAEGRRVGIVEGVQAYKWFTITIQGLDSHTGATSFQHRADALLTASKMILASHKIARRHKALASTGILNLKPGSTNTVPGFVQFSLDIRAPLDETVENVESECRNAFGSIAAGGSAEGVNEDCAPSDKHCDVEWRTDFVSPATHFNQDCIACVQQAAHGLCTGSAGGDVTAEMNGKNIGDWGKLMTSGAGHDSVYTSKHFPTCMVFAPCRDGVSHNPREYSSPDACGDGANVLLGAVLRYDRLRSERQEVGKDGLRFGRL